MTRKTMLQVGAIAAFAGVALSIIATVSEPAVPGAPAEQMRLIADNGYFTANRVIDVVGTVLVLLALAIVGRTFRGGAAEDWSRIGQVLLAAGIGIGIAAITLGIAVYNVAIAGVEAAAAEQAGYVAAVDALGYAVAAVFAASFVIIGVYLATLAAAILSSAEYPRWIGWFAAVASGLLVVGVLGYLVAADEIFLLALLGFLLWMIATVALGLKLWQKSGTTMADSTADLPPAPATGVAP